MNLMRYPNIEKERIRNGMGKVKFARSIGSSPTTVKNWQSGKTEIPVGKIIIMAELFNVSTDYLLGRSTSN